MKTSRIDPVPPKIVRHIEKKGAAKKKRNKNCTGKFYTLTNGIQIRKDIMGSEIYNGNKVLS